MYFAVFVCVAFAGVSEAALSFRLGGCTVERFPASSFVSAANRYEEQGDCRLCYCENRNANVTCETCGTMRMTVFPCEYKNMLNDTCYFGMSSTLYPDCCNTFRSICESSGNYTSVFNSADFASFNETHFAEAATCDPTATPPPYRIITMTG
ncbi:uncharacterized protein LOC141903935 [Tubulanus polymorphus]|uniref:uncharacterized protein LOC141903935 n=1 Tax=Tubulanus polymorphus TaxID=672921 RepID=UPI003DA573C8